MAGPIRKRVQWLALHGVVRGISKLFARRGDPQGRLIADPAVPANPVPFTEELRAQGPIVKCRAVYITVDHKICNDLLRSDDFHVLSMGSNLPKALQWVVDRTKPDELMVTAQVYDHAARVGSFELLMEAVSQPSPALAK